MQNDKKEEIKPHSIALDNREKCSVTGIKKVVGATENCITALSSYGPLSFLGNNLKLTSFSESNGTLSFSGEISCIKYGDKSGALKRIFK